MSVSLMMALFEWPKGAREWSASSQMETGSCGCVMEPIKVAALRTLDVFQEENFEQWRPVSQK